MNPVPVGMGQRQLNPAVADRDPYHRDVGTGTVIWTNRELSLSLGLATHQARSAVRLVRIETRREANEP